MTYSIWIVQSDEGFVAVVRSLPAAPRSTRPKRRRSPK